MSSEKAGKPLVRVDGLAATLADGREILSDVSFEVGQGEIVALIGESGSGKTTTALALLGYATPGSPCRGWLKSAAIRFWNWTKANCAQSAGERSDTYPRTLRRH